MIEEELLPRIPERDEGDRREDDPHLIDSLVSKIVIDSQLRGGYLRVGFGNQGFKAYLVEYGHRMVGHKPGKKYLGVDVPPHPFMRPAASAAADKVVTAFAEVLASTLRGGIF